MEVKRRVLIIVQNLPVPFDRRVWLECQALTAAGYRVAVVCPKGKGDPAYEVIDDVELYKYRPYAPGGSKLSFVAEYAYSFAATAWKTTLARARGGVLRGRFAVIQACNPPDIFWPLAMAFKAVERTKFVFDHHDLCPELFESRFGGEAVRVAAVPGAALPGAPHAPHRRPRDLHQRLLPSDRHRQKRQAALQTLQSSAPARTRPSCSAASRTRAQQRGRKHLAAYIGVMGPQDGVDIVVRAAGVIVHELEREDIAFTLIGKGDCFDELVALRDELEPERATSSSPAGHPTSWSRRSCPPPTSACRRTR